MRLIKIDKDENIKYNKEIKAYLNPDYIYVPIEDGANILVRNHDEINLDTILCEKDGIVSLSSVSGKVIGLKNMYVNKNLTKCIVVENNFREDGKLIKSKRRIDNIAKEEFVNLIRKYTNINEDFNSNNLIVSAIDYEIYEMVLSKLINSYADDILDTIDAIVKILDIKKCILAIKDNDSDNVVSLLNLIGTYPNIQLKLMPDLYPVGNKQILSKELMGKEKTIFLDVSDILNILNILRKGKPLCYKYVTFSGNKINKSVVLKVKLGTNIKEIIANNFKIIDDDYHLVVNGLLSGYELNSLDTIITEEVRSVFITSAITDKETKCLNCGLCVKHCPVGANPRTGYKMDKCIKCGLCHYVCPANRR